TYLRTYLLAFDRLHRVIPPTAENRIGDRTGFELAIAVLDVGWLHVDRVAQIHGADIRFNAARQVARIEVRLRSIVSNQHIQPIRELVRDLGPHVARLAVEKRIRSAPAHRAHGLTGKLKETGALKAVLLAGYIRPSANALKSNGV